MPPETEAPLDPTRRGALACLGMAAGTLFSLSGGLLTAAPLAQAATQKGKPLFVQLSDTHIGFRQPANMDVDATLSAVVDRINALAVQPSLVLHTGDITQLSRAEEFDRAQQLMSRLRATELHTTPGEHDVVDGPGAEYFARFGQASKGLGYYSFDHDGVHFVALVNAMNFKPGGLGELGEAQLAWLENDWPAALQPAAGRSSPTCRCGRSTSRGAGAPATPTR